MITRIDDSLALEIEQLPRLSTIFPYKFGGSVIDGIAVTCGSCGEELSPKTIRGTIEIVAGGRAVNMTAYGICFKCKTITPVVSKFHDDGVVLIKVGKGWIKDVWTTRKRGFCDNAVKFVRQKWQQIFPPVIAVAIVIGWIIWRRIL